MLPKVVFGKVLSEGLICFRNEMGDMGISWVSEEKISWALSVFSMCQWCNGLYFLKSVFNFFEIIEFPIVITISGMKLGSDPILSKTLSIQDMNFSP